MYTFYGYVAFYISTAQVSRALRALRPGHPGPGSRESLRARGDEDTQAGGEGKGRRCWHAPSAPDSNVHASCDRSLRVDVSPLLRGLKVHRTYL